MRRTVQIVILRRFTILKPRGLFKMEARHTCTYHSE